MFGKGQQAAGWTGIYMDAMGSMAFYGFKSRPIDPLTGTPFTLGINTHVLAYVAQGGVFEECFRDATDGSPRGRRC